MRQKYELLRDKKKNEANRDARRVDSRKKIARRKLVTSSRTPIPS